ncbi:unnamed protein product, partial [Laminaria digitata]
VLPEGGRRRIIPPRLPPVFHVYGKNIAVLQFSAKGFCRCRWCSVSKGREAAGGRAADSDKVSCGALAFVMLCFLPGAGGALNPFTVYCENGPSLIPSSLSSKTW